MNPDRQKQQLNFLQQHGWHEARRETLAQDASRRVYYRLFQQNRRVVLMDAPPPENLPAFINISSHLKRLGHVVPGILHSNREQGFALIDDLGDDTFTRLLSRGEDLHILYDLALDTLIQLQQHPLATDINVPVYDQSRMLEEVGRFMKWYFPVIKGEQCSEGLYDTWLAAWSAVFDRLPDVPHTLTLRDFHVDNLMGVGEGESRRCGLLDFQDAVLGPHVYDLVSLLEDARRDVPEEVRQHLLQRYLETMKLAHEPFMAWYQVLGCQRHFKVAGIFMRLGVEQQRHHYLTHLPRILGLIQRHIRTDHLQPVRHWLDNNFPAYSQLLDANELLKKYEKNQ